MAVRFHMNRETDRRAYEFLQERGKAEYRSHSRAIIAAVDGFFSRKEQTDKDPYLETREKEDAFLEKIEQAVAQGAKNAVQELRADDTPAPELTRPSNTAAEEDADFDIAMAFIDSL